jgi:isopentenyldiphosphate isomerase
VFSPGDPSGDPFSDPNELFDVCRSDGTPTGAVKRRADVHRDGDWHRSFHCWVTCLPPQGHPPPAPLLILQRRGLQKDTWPGRLDASVGGHYRAGETLRDVLREVEEEIGQGVRLEDLLPLGHRVAVSEPDGVTRDRELQDLFLWRSGLPLDAFRPQPVEVAALEAVAVPDLLRLFTGEAPVAPAVALTPDGRVSSREVRVEDFIPTFDRYFYRMAVLVDLAARDYPHLVA